MCWKILARTKLTQTRQHINPHKQKGLSLVELLAALTIATLIIAGLSGVVSQALDTERFVRVNNDIQQQARFAMREMVQAISRSQRLMLPLGENANTVWSESVRDPGVLAVTMDPFLDRNKDGFADVDNDKDGRIDEDLANDNTNDGFPGIIGIDDDNDGNVDESVSADNDEDGTENEDYIDGIDNDGDGSIDEDIHQDNNMDQKPGVVDVDDDGDGSTDEGQNKNNDEDDLTGEDWFDVVVFFLNGTTLMQRIPNINPTDGTDYTEYPIAENVSQFRVERIPQAYGRAILIDLSLTLTDASGESTHLNTQVRVGGGL